MGLLHHAQSAPTATASRKGDCPYCQLNHIYDDDDSDPDVAADLDRFSDRACGFCSPSPLPIPIRTPPGPTEADLRARAARRERLFHPLDYRDRTLIVTGEDNGRPASKGLLYALNSHPCAQRSST